MNSLAVNSEAFYDRIHSGNLLKKETFYPLSNKISNCYLKDTFVSCFSGICQVECDVTGRPGYLCQVQLAVDESSLLCQHALPLHEFFE